MDGDKGDDTSVAPKFTDLAQLTKDNGDKLDKIYTEAKIQTMHLSNLCKLKKKQQQSDNEKHASSSQIAIWALVIALINIALFFNIDAVKGWF